MVEVKKILENDYYKLVKVTEDGNSYLSVRTLVTQDLLLPDIYVDEKNDGVKFYLLPDAYNFIYKTEAFKIIKGYEISKKTLEYFNNKIDSIVKEVKYYYYKDEDDVVKIIKENKYYDGDTTKAVVIYNVSEQEAENICNILNSSESIIGFGEFYEDV